MRPYYNTDRRKNWTSSFSDRTAGQWNRTWRISHKPQFNYDIGKVGGKKDPDWDKMHEGKGDCGKSKFRRRINKNLRSFVLKKKTPQRTGRIVHKYS